jgi:hypothetical protein
MKKFLYTLIFTTTVLFSETQSNEFREKNNARQILDFWAETNSEIHVLVHQIDLDDGYLFYLDGKLEAYEECLYIICPEIFEELDYMHYLYLPLD